LLLKIDYNTGKNYILLSLLYNTILKTFQKKKMDNRKKIKIKKKKNKNKIKIIQIYDGQLMAFKTHQFLLLFKVYF